jgi:hypothetical protein
LRPFNHPKAWDLVERDDKYFITQQTSATWSKRRVAGEYSKATTNGRPVAFLRFGFHQY